MKKRLKGLLCLWLAVLVVAAPAVGAVSAAETDEEGNPYLYVYRGENDLSQRDRVLADDQETRKTTFNFDESLYQQSNIVHQVLTPEGRELDGWKVWRYYSGFVYTPNMDNLPDKLPKDGTITREYYENLIGSDSSSYILLEPVFIQRPAIILPEAMVGYEISDAEWITSGGNPAYTFTVTIFATHEASSSFAVSANGVKLVPTKTVGSYQSTYLIENITETQTISVVGVVDRINPQLKIEFSDGVYWDNFHSVAGVTGVYKYFNKAQTITLSTSPESLKSNGIWYKVASGDLLNWNEVTADNKTEALEAAVVAAGGWEPYESPIELVDDGNYVVYAKAVGSESNTNYANTEMFVIDRTAPVISDNVIADLQYKGNLTFSVEDANLDSVTVDGEEVEPVGNEYTLTADCRRHTIVAKDKAGNATVVRNVYVFDEYEISKTAAEGGSFTVMCEDEEVTVAQPNSEVVVTTSAEEGYSVDKIIVTKTGDESTQVTVTDGKFIMPPYPVTVTVNFRKKAYLVTLPVSPMGGYTVTPADGSVSPALHGSDFVFTVTIADGYKASDSYSVSANGTVLTPVIDGNTYTYTIKNITEEQEIMIRGIVSATAPSIAIKVENDSTQWTDFLPKISSDHFFNEPITIDMSATEADSGTELTEIWYYIADGDLFPVNRRYTEQEIESTMSAAGTWNLYGRQIELADDGTYVVYVKAEDSDSNTGYANTELLVIDKTAPGIWNETTGDVVDELQYKGDLTFSVNDSNLDYVTVDGERVVLDDNEYIITADCKWHTIEAWDKAGNGTAIRVYVYDEYEISKTAAEGGNFTVMCKGKEVTVAEPDSEIVVTASAEEGYSVDEIIVTKTGDENTQVTVTDGKFTMPSYPVTVTVNFRKKAYSVTLPAAPTVGYTVAPVNGSVSPAFHGSDFVFTVTIAEGYKASDSYSVSTNGTVLTPEIDGNTFTYTIKNITEEQEVTVSGIVSAVAPSITVTVENDSAQWTDFLPEISFDYFFNKAITIDVSATEEDSGAKLTDIWYYIADSDLFPENRDYTDQEIEEAVSIWTGYTDGITLAENGNHVVYIKAMDSNGNVAYVNTAGIVIDTVLPTIFGVENGGVYYGDTVIRASDDNLDTVKVDGIAVQLTNGAYTISADNQTHTVAVTDKAGNQISYKLYTYETWVRDGIQTAGTLRLTAGTGYRLGSGKWKVSGDETVYEGGNSFYVAETGSYDFAQQ